MLVQCLRILRNKAWRKEPEYRQVIGKMSGTNRRSHFDEQVSHILHDENIKSNESLQKNNLCFEYFE